MRLATYQIRIRKDPYFFSCHLLHDKKRKMLFAAIPLIGQPKSRVSGIFSFNAINSRGGRQNAQVECGYNVFLQYITDVA